VSRAFLVKEQVSHVWLLRREIRRPQPVRRGPRANRLSGSDSRQESPLNRPDPDPSSTGAHARASEKNRHEVDGNQEVGNYLNRLGLASSCRASRSADMSVAHSSQGQPSVPGPAAFCCTFEHQSRTDVSSSRGPSRGVRSLLPRAGAKVTTGCAWGLAIPARPKKNP